MKQPEVTKALPLMTMALDAFPITAITGLRALTAIAGDTKSLRERYRLFNPF